MFAAQGRSIRRTAQARAGSGTCGLGVVQSAGRLEHAIVVPLAGRIKHWFGSGPHTANPADPVRGHKDEIRQPRVGESWVHSVELQDCRPRLLQHGRAGCVQERRTALWVQRTSQPKGQAAVAWVLAGDLTSSITELISSSVSSRRRQEKGRGLRGLITHVFRFSFLFARSLACFYVRHLRALYCTHRSLLSLSEIHVLIAPGRAPRCAPRAPARAAACP